MTKKYEIAYGMIIPEFKRAVAKEMYSRYNMTQVEIAKRLGVTQAAVSKYLSSRKATVKSEEVTNFIEASIKGDRNAMKDSLCRACQTESKFGCAFIFKQ